MPDLTIRHEFDCDEDTFWNSCVFGDAFNEELYRNVLHAKHYEVLAQTDEPEKRTRRVKVEPQVGKMPGPVAKLLGDRLAYTEEGSFDKKTKRYTFHVTPSAAPDKTKTQGELYCEKLGDKKIARVAKIHVECKVFAIGGMIEDKIVSDLKSSYDLAAKFTNEWVKQKGL